VEVLDSATRPRFQTAVVVLPGLPVIPSLAQEGVGHQLTQVWDTFECITAIPNGRIWGSVGEPSPSISGWVATQHFDRKGRRCPTRSTTRLGHSTSEFLNATMYELSGSQKVRTPGSTPPFRITCSSLGGPPGPLIGGRSIPMFIGDR